MRTVLALAKSILAALLDVQATQAKQQQQLDRIEAAVAEPQPVPAGTVITLSKGPTE